MAQSRKFKVAEISWIDAEAAEAGWTEDDPTSIPTLLKTYGILIREDDPTWIVHASTFDPDTNRYSERAKIPRGMVLGIRIIEEIEIELPEKAG